MDSCCEATCTSFSIWGYVTVNPTTMKIEVSKRIKAEFENGRDYYRLEGCPLAEPLNPLALPSNELLRAHYENVFKR